MKLNQLINKYDVNNFNLIFIIYFCFVFCNYSQDALAKTFSFLSYIFRHSLIFITLVNYSISKLKIELSLCWSYLESFCLEHFFVILRRGRRQLLVSLLCLYFCLFSLILSSHHCYFYSISSTRLALHLFKKKIVQVSELLYESTIN